MKVFLSNMLKYLIIRNGTPKTIVKEHINNGIDVVFDIDWQGAQKLYSFSSTDVVSIFISTK